MRFMFDFLKGWLGTAQSRLLGRYQKLVSKIVKEEERLQQLSDEEIRAKTAEFRSRLQEGEPLDSLLVEAYAVVKNVCRRLVGTQVHVSGYDQQWDMVPYDVQLLGAIALHFGSIAEMQTGEGKTLTAAIPLYLNALTGKPVHLVTVNDYLVTRDVEWIGAIFRWLGLSVTALTHSVPPHKRKEVYAADIVYGTASEFGFDYLRDNSMVQSQEEQCQRGQFFAIIDEVDSILIDEARTPLIISGPSGTSRQMYDSLKEEISHLVRYQRDWCNRLASDARKTLEKFDLLEESAEQKNLSKENEMEKQECLRKLWIVAKGNPQNKVLKKIKENPDLRLQLDKWDTYFYAETNKEEKAQALAELFMIVDEKQSEFELTDKGIQRWIEETKGTTSHDDFVMLDLGHEYAKIDEDSLLDEQERLKRRIALREQDALRKERAHNLRQLLRAHLLMEKDVDYIVADGKVIIIDENTGRPQPGRRFSDGLHQAIEAKEGLLIQGETQTYATITLQNYFRMYTKLAGMTGTAMTEANEFKEIYKLEVLAIPTHNPCQRMDADDQIYMTEREKYSAILKEVERVHTQGLPILIGTESVEVSEKLSRILKQNRLEHTVLNAKNHAQEAEIIALAGKKGAITVATNMAGRGTDIKLAPEIAKLGGLRVIGTSRHQSRRTDRQLRGRSARQGDPGSSIFYVSFEDSLMRLFSSPRITALLQRFRPPEGEAISAKVLSKSIETAQKRVEQRNYTIRKHTLEYDDVMNKQRTEIYSFRNEILRAQDSLLLAKEVLDGLIDRVAGRYFQNQSQEGGWDTKGFCEWLMLHFPLRFDAEQFDNDYLKIEEIIATTTARVLGAFDQKISPQAERLSQGQAPNFDALEVLRAVVKNLLIRCVDRLWQEHLLRIDHLRTEVHLRAIGQKDPLLEFKHEAFALFDKLSLRIQEEIAHALFRFELAPPMQRTTTPPKRQRPPVFDLSQLQ